MNASTVAHRHAAQGTNGDGLEVVVLDQVVYANDGGHISTSFPGRAWERTGFEALPRQTGIGEAEPRGSAFPGRAWERGEGAK